MLFKRFFFLQKWTESSLTVHKLGAMEMFESGRLILDIYMNVNLNLLSNYIFSCMLKGCFSWPKSDYERILRTKNDSWSKIQFQDDPRPLNLYFI